MVKTMFIFYVFELIKRSEDISIITNFLPISPVLSLYMTPYPLMENLTVINFDAGSFQNPVCVFPFSRRSLFISRFLLALDVSCKMFHR